MEGSCLKLITLLKRKKATLVSVESCTGGLLGAWITAIPGCSSVYQGGWITYSNHAKHRDVHVPISVLEKHGAVSHQTACAMAQGALKNGTLKSGTLKSGALQKTQDQTHRAYAIAITGIAGPSGGSLLEGEKPVGLFYLALGAKGKEGTESIQWEKHHHQGSREAIRNKAVQAALQFLIKTLS